MSDAGWAGLLTAIHDMLFACDRETRFALAGAERRLWLTVQADSVTVEIPAYDPARLTTLGWRAPADGRDEWFYEVPRTVEHVEWLCRFAVQDGPVMPYSSEVFDLAVTADDESAWPEVARVLKRGGILVGSGVALEGRPAFERAVADVGLRAVFVLDVTAYALAFYRAKEQEAKLLVEAGLMPASDLQSLQMYTVDLYEAGGASHLLFRIEKP